MGKCSKGNERFGTDVAVHIARVMSTDRKGSKLQQCLDMGFESYAGFDELIDEDEEGIAFI